MQVKILSILKVLSFESLARNDFSERDTQAEAHYERNTSHFVGIIIKAGGASVKVTDLLFAFAFCKRQTRKTGVLARLAVCCLLISINKFSEPRF